MAQRFFNPAPQFFYSGTPAAPLSGGLMYFYEPGTTTPKDTYSDNGLSVPNTNPVVLSSSGVLPNVFLDGSYKAVLTDKNGVQQPGWPRDSVNSIGGLAFANWDSTIIYGDGGSNIVTASNGKYYISLQANNAAHEPSVSPTWWDQIYFLTVWNANITYALEDLVIQDGVLYSSQQNNNLNHDPALGDAAWWLPPTNITVANQATMEAATNNDEMVTPLGTNWHPGVRKMWAKFTNAGVIQASHNVTSVTDNGVGDLTVTIATDFSSAHYDVSTSFLGSGGSYSVGALNPPLAGSIQVVCYDSSTGAAADPLSYFVGADGDQA